MDPEPPPQEAAPTTPPRRRGARRWLVLAIAAIVVCAAFVIGVLPRISERETVERETAEQAVPYVVITRPVRAAPERELVLPGNVQAFSNAPIFARINGYLQRWYVDIGAHVKAGQLLAVISAPEVEQQLQQARATLAISEANLRLSETTSGRYVDLRKTSSVSQQDVDNTVGALEANQAAVRANRANVRQLEQTLSYAQIRAPFAGVITARNIDVGDLINAGAGTVELFHLVQTDKLRVYVNVPEASSQVTLPGLVATLTLAAHPGTQLTGKLIRTANAIEPTTRTLLAEIEVDNPTGTLFSGTYAQVRLQVPAPRATYILPVENLIFRKEGLHVATVTNGRAVLKKVVPGHDFGDRIEIVEGLTGDEAVVMNPPDSITTGERVRVAEREAPNEPAPQASANK